MKTVHFIKVASLSAIFLLSVTPTFANFSSITNNVTNNSNGGSSEVNIQNNLGSNSRSLNFQTKNDHADLTITTNGQTKEYHSDTPGNVSLQSDDGTSKVTVNNDSNTTTDTDSSGTSGSNVNSSLSPTPTDNELPDDVLDTSALPVKQIAKAPPQTHRSLIAVIVSFFKSLFSI